MSVTKTLRTPVDTWIVEFSPGLTKVYSHIIRLCGDTGSRRRAFMFFPNLALDDRFTVLSATLYLYADGSSSGSENVVIERITSRWKAQRATWNNQPTVSTSNSATTAIGALSDGDEITFNLRPMLNDVASGKPWYGFRIRSTGTNLRDFSSAQSTKPGRKPRLVVEYARQPGEPTDLRPSGGDAVGTQTPNLAWSTDISQLQFQVQISSDRSLFLANVVHDSGSVTDDKQLYRLSETGYNLPGGGDLRYWRVRTKNQAGVWSEYSDIVGMRYVAQGTLNITNPPAVTPIVEETTPPIDWSFSGQTQQAYRVTLYDLGNIVEGAVFDGWGDDWGTRWGSPGWQEIWDSGWQKSTDTRVTVPPHQIRRLDNAFYKVRVQVRDTVDRTASPGSPAYVEAERIFSFQEVATVSPVSGLTATNPEGWYIQLDWTDATQPDYYGFKVDGEYVLDRETPSKYHTTGTNYRKKFYHSRPLRSSEFEVVRIVKDGAQVYKHSRHADNPIATFRFIPLGIWLADEDTDEAVNIGRGEDVADLDIHIGEGDTVYFPIGRRDPVRIVDSVRGYEGVVTGMIRGRTDKEMFEHFKSQLPHKQFRLITGDISIRVHLGEITKLAPMGNPLRSTTSAADKLWAVAFEVFQSDDWTFMARY